MPIVCEKGPDAIAAAGAAEVLDCLEALRRGGVDPELEAPAAGIDLESLRHGDAVPAAALVKLFEQLERKTGDRLIGLHSAERAEPRGPLAHLLMSCSRLEDALLRCCRFGPVLLTTMRITLREEADATAFEYDFGAPGLAASRQLVQYTLMSTARTLWRAVGDDAHFAAVCFRSDDAGDRREIERAFRCPARFGQSADSLLIPRRVAERTPAMSNPRIAEQIEKFAAALLPEQPPAESFREQVLHVTRSLLSAGVRAERRQVGRRLGVSERTLHRRLADQGATFRDLRETVLWELAEALVSDRDLKLEAVAESLGFNDAAAFSKAFKRHCGSSPAAWRRSVPAASRQG